MHAVDTNVLVRLVTRHDESQTAAAEAFIASGAWVSHLVLAETVWVLSTVYARNSKEIALAVEMLLDHDKLTLDDPDVIEAALTRFRNKPSLGFSHCIVLEQARARGHLPLGTFDRELAKSPGAHRIVTR